MGVVKYSGPVASFHCPTEATIRSLKVHFSPKQLGSGTPSPENVREIVGWDRVKVEQSGKNLFDANNPNIITPNCWASSNAPNKITASNADRTLYIACLPNTTYVISKTVGDVLAAGYTTDLPALDVQIYSYMRDRNSARQVTVTTGSDAKYLVIWFYDYSKTYDRTVQPEDIYKTLQIEYGSTITSYEPYHGSTTNYEFGVLGKNKFDPNCTMLTSSGIYSVSNGVITQTGSDGRGWVDEHFPPVELKAGTYTISSSDNCTINLATSIDGYQTITRFSKGPGTFTLAEDCSIKFKCSGSEYPLEHTIQIELGSTATAYEPYDPNKTVYGGYVDLVTGKVVATYLKYVFNSSQNWSAIGRVSTTGGYYFYNDLINQPAYYCSLSPGQIYQSKQQELFTHGKIDNPYSENKYCAWVFQPSSTQVTFRVSLPDSLNITTSSQFKDWLDEQGEVAIVYPLATPQEYSLAPTQMQTFLSQNNIWSNADYVEVEYDLHETQNILARKQFIIANQPHVETLAAAPLQNFMTDMAAPLKECKVHFGPIQDLHGYSKPWVGGSGKNLFNINAVEQDPSDTTLSNATKRVFTPNTYSVGASYSNWWQPNKISNYSISNNSITVTSSTGYGVCFAIKAKPETYYTVSATVVGDNPHINNAYYDSEGNYLGSASTGGNITTFQTPENTDMMVIIFAPVNNTEATFSNIQVEEGQTATAYEPWENVCPIEGQNELDLYRTRRNIWDEQWEAGILNTTTGANYATNNQIRAKNYIPVKPGESYFFHSSKSGVGMWCILFDKDKKVITEFNNPNGYSRSSNVINLNCKAFTIPENCYYLRFYMTAAYGDEYHDDIMISRGSIDVGYEPYTGTTIPITFPSEAGTVYGGYVDLVTGEVWRTWREVNLGDLSWRIFEGVFYNWPNTSTVTGTADKKPGITNVICPNYATEVETLKNQWSVSEGRISGWNASTTKYLYIKDSRFTTTNDFKTAVDGVYAYYELETPTFITTLTPTQLKTLRGTNNIWSNAGNIELSYWKY